MKEEIQVLISTMNKEEDEEIKRLLKEMQITSNYLVINQSKKGRRISNKKVISVKEKGISKSRNRGIKESEGEIIVIGDDDEVYEKGYKEIIEEEYRKDKKADIICFWVESENKEREIRKLKRGKVNKIKILRINSVEITFRKERIKGIKFDEEYGIGAKYNRGEEAIFLADCIRKGLKIKYVDKKIAKVKQRESSWFKGYDEDYLKIQGKVFKRIYPKMYKLICLQFAIRKYNLYKENISLLKAIKLLCIN